MKKIIQEPLVVFLLLGGLLFFVFQQTAGDIVPDKSEIMVTSGRVTALKQGFKKVWQRAPTDKELNGLIDSFVREEVLYREALAMGLDRGDVIIKRRLGQKMTFLFEDIAKLEQPDDQQLQAFLTAHKENYRQPASLSFRQIYFDPRKRGQTTNSDAIATIKVLQAQEADISKLGDKLMLNQQFYQQPEREISRAFGSEFLQSVLKMPTGSWQGPTRSGFGLHLVHIDERIEGKTSELDQVRKQVSRDWASDQRKLVDKKFYANLRQRYKVTIEGGPDGNDAPIADAKATR